MAADLGQTIAPICILLCGIFIFGTLTWVHVSNFKQQKELKKRRAAYDAERALQRQQETLQLFAALLVTRKSPEPVKAELPDPHNPGRRRILKLAN